MKPILAPVLAALLLAACANPYHLHQQPRTTYRAPATRTGDTTGATRRNTQDATPASAPAMPSSIAQPLPEAPTATPVATPAKAAAPDPGSNVPMMGFRPMRGQKTPGA